jgi:4-amino-4-deoxy-L-arabinose transferase-like glycosyltransferase
MAPHSATIEPRVDEAPGLPLLTTRPRRLPSVLLGGLALLAVYALFFHRLGDRDLWSSHEARAGMDAQMILDEGIWGLPRLYDGRPELQKPPLYYWLVASMAWLRGGSVDAQAVRLPAAGAALGCALAVLAGLRFGRDRALAGMLAALVLATALHFTWLARIGRIDMPLTLAVTLAVGGLYLARSQERPFRLPLLVLAYLGIAAGVMLKGPIGLVLPAAVMILHLTMEHGLPSPARWRCWIAALRDMGVWWGVPLVALLTLPWFIWANHHTQGEFFRVFLWHHNFERGYGGSTLRSNPWWFYLPQFTADFLPWSVVLPLAGWWGYRRGLWRQDADARFGLAWFASILLVLSCARFKRADYLLPAYPGAALFLGCIGQHCWQALSHRKRGTLALGFIALVILMIGIWWVRVEKQLPAREPYRDYRAFAAHIRREAPAPEEVIFFRTEAHALAFRIGRPLAVLVEWRELSARLCRPGDHSIVTPPQYAAECLRYLHGVRLEKVVSNTDLSEIGHERPLVLLRVESSGTTSAGQSTP